MIFQKIHTLSYMVLKVPFHTITRDYLKMQDLHYGMNLEYYILMMFILTLLVPEFKLIMDLCYFKKEQKVFLKFFCHFWKLYCLLSSYAYFKTSDSLVIVIFIPISFKTI